MSIKKTLNYSHMIFEQRMSISFSIITPVYNRQDCIEKCLDSVAKQNNDNVEHIVINDGSTDMSLEIVKANAASNCNIKLLSLKKNCGPNTARNLGIKNAKNRIILFLDSDDELMPKALNNIASTIQSNMNIRCFLFLNSDKEKRSDTHPILKKGSQVFNYEMFLTKELDFSLDFSYVFYKDDLTHHPFDERLRIYENICYLNIFQKHKRIHYTNSVVIKRNRNRLDSISNENFLFSNKQLKDALIYYEELIKHYHNSLSKKEKIIEHQIQKKIHFLRYILCVDKKNTIAYIIKWMIQLYAYCKLYCSFIRKSILIL